MAIHNAVLMLIILFGSQKPHTYRENRTDCWCVDEFPNQAESPYSGQSGLTMEKKEGVFM